MNTKPEDVSSTVLPSSPQAGASVTYCLQKRNIEGSADQSHHLVNKKEKIRGRDSSGRDSSERESQGAHQAPLPQSRGTSSHTRDPAGRGLKPGATSHRLHTAEQWGLQDAIRSNMVRQKLLPGNQEMDRDKTPHKEKAHHPRPPSKNAGFCIALSGKWGAEMDLATQCSVSGLICWVPWPLSKAHGCYWVGKRGPKDVVASSSL